MKEYQKLRISHYFLGLFCAVLTVGCTDLEEELEDVLDNDQASEFISGAQFLEGAYASLAQFQDQGRVWALLTHPSKQLAGPTRGTDWDDGGVWRQLHQHNWGISNPFVVDTYSALLAGVNDATNVLGFDVDASTAAQAKFVRGFNLFFTIDLFGQAAVREPGEDLREVPSIFITRQTAADFLINDIEPNINDFPTSGGTNMNSSDIATKWAAHALLAKIYLNKAVWGASNPEGPYTFTDTDLNAVIVHCDAIINSGNFSLETDYYENFSPTNGQQSTELIFVSKNNPGQDLNPDLNDVQSRHRMSMHYNQNPGGWNGFVALTDMYNLLEDGDIRKTSDPAISNVVSPSAQIMTDMTGVVPGFILGQQVDNNGTLLEDRTGELLIFTTDFSIASSNERQGIRQVKYLPDFENGVDLPDTDYVLFRYSDILLMKAEALLRSGDAAAALAIVNTIRAVRGAGALTTLNEMELLNERNRELWIEGWGRNDEIRFGTFMNAAQEKPVTGSPAFILFPIPPEALGTNPNLIQNPGY